MKRKGNRRSGETDETREYEPEEVEELIRRASDRLEELHTVMGEMTGRLRALALGEETP